MTVGIPAEEPAFLRAGDLADEYTAVDWSRTSLGPPAEWSPTLRSALDLVRNTRFPVTLLWGADLVLLYNEAYIELIGDKHPASLGRPGREVFPEVWADVGPMLGGVLAGGAATWSQDVLVPLKRNGFVEETYFTFSYSPVHGPDGVVEGIVDITAESTSSILATRRLITAASLDRRLEQARTIDDFAAVTTAVLGGSTADFVAATVHLTAADQRGADAPPDRVRVDAGPEGRTAWVPVLGGHGLLELGLNPMLRLDELHLEFLRLVGRTVGQHLTRLEKDAAARELSVSLQKALLTQPRHSPAFDIAVHYEPATLAAEVGGDWHDAFACADGSLMISIGDVFGHDHRAAGVMAQLRNVLRGIAYLDGGSPARALSTLEQAMPGLGLDALATSIVATLKELGAGAAQLSWSNAGHLPPVLIAPDGAAVLLERVPDALIGLEDGLVRHDHQLVLPVGSTLLLYTDGLVERRGESLDQGLARLLDRLRDTHQMAPEELCAHALGLMADLSRAEDDVALLVVRLQDPAAS